jgi:hypothetical protein
MSPMMSPMMAGIGRGSGTGNGIKLSADFITGSILSGTFTRASTSPWQDSDGNLRLALIDQPVYPGRRHVRNLLPYSEDFSNPGYATEGTATMTPDYGVAPDGTQTACRITTTFLGSFVKKTSAAIIDKTRSCWVKSNTESPQSIWFGGKEGSGISATTEWQRFSLFTAVLSNLFQIGTDSTSDISCDILVWHPQSEDVTGQTNQNPGEYVPTTSAAAASEYFDYENPNTVDINGVVTEGPHVPRWQ